MKTIAKFKAFRHTYAGRPNYLKYYWEGTDNSKTDSSNTRFRPCLRKSIVACFMIKLSPFAKVVHLSNLILGTTYWFNSAWTAESSALSSSRAKKQCSPIRDETFQWRIVMSTFALTAVPIQLMLQRPEPWILLGKCHNYWCHEVLIRIGSSGCILLSFFALKKKTHFPLLVI